MLIACPDLHRDSFTYFITLHLTLQTIPGKQNTSWSPALCSFVQYPVTSALLCLNIFLSTLFPTIVSLCSSLKVTNQVAHPHKTKHKIIVMLSFNLCISANWKTTPSGPNSTSSSWHFMNLTCFWFPTNQYHALTLCKIWNLSVMQKGGLFNSTEH